MTEGWLHARFMPWWLGASLIGVREEGLKLLFFIALADADPDIRSSGDRLHAMTAVALGFAVIEAIAHAMPHGVMSRVLLQAYVGLYIGTALHVFLSIQAAAFIIVARRTSRFWLAGIVIPMSLHSIWDSPYLIGISTADTAMYARILIMAATTGGALVLTKLSGAEPSHSIFARQLALAAMTVWLGLTTVLQIAGKAGWHYGVDVNLYTQMAIGWWMVGLDLALIYFLTGNGKDRDLIH
ncbi:hypothetical protein KGY14_15900 [Ameyamaea chiangmaiensis]|uniref:Uncharacterized protein n=1 Tax=Ameyamaea chiangmaiensis TaxID=442969 RepID=A0A850PC26_9PROT|nr:hypothetical protein [Ameyamaea chiangmaiensis]MBS4076659.1 hypothetical protein [Ameyamaea chiangmaiensis]NVN42067.1 hypothetical protein [Ameyamaea chiangmaiensis]